MSDGPRLSIGEVIARLAGEFPELTVSEIQFLEAEGLLTPERGTTGYRRFTETDLERLRWLLGVRRDRGVPLRALRRRLEPRTAPPHTDPSDVFGADFFASHVSGGVGELRLDRDQLAKAAGITPDDVDTLSDYGLIAAQPPYDDNALLVAKAATALARHGLEPRHLRPVVAAVDRTADLLGRAAVPRRAARGDTERTPERLAAEVVRLYAALLRSAMTRITAHGR